MKWLPYLHSKVMMYRPVVVVFSDEALLLVIERN